MTYELWWVSADGQQAIHADYPARSYRTEPDAWQAVPEALRWLVSEQQAADPGGAEDPHAIARLWTGRWRCYEVEAQS